MKIVNCLVLGEMCEAALDGEPVFVIRAKDALSRDTLNYYLVRAKDASTTNQGRIQTAITKFEEWRKNNKDKVKMPD